MQAAEWINLCIAIITALVCVANFRLLRETRRTSKIMEDQVAANTRPYVQAGITVRKGAPVLMLTVTNAGNTAATDLKLTLDRDFYRNSERMDDANLRNYSAFKDVIASFGPRMELRFMLGVGRSVFENTELCPRQFTLTAEYSHGGTKYVESTVLDLNPFGLHDASADSLDTRLADINKALQALVKKIG